VWEGGREGVTLAGDSRNWPSTQTGKNPLNLESNIWEKKTMTALGRRKGKKRSRRTIKGKEKEPSTNLIKENAKSTFLR